MCLLPSLVLLVLVLLFRWFVLVSFWSTGLQSLGLYLALGWLLSFFVVACLLIGLQQLYAWQSIPLDLKCVTLPAGAACTCHMSAPAWSQPTQCLHTETHDRVACVRVVH